MSRIRTTTRLLTAAAALAAGAALAAPALAAERDASSGPLAVEVPGEQVLERAERREARERRRARAKRRERRAPDGPFVPLVGKADYGNELNAFGYARGRLHAGHDMFAPAGTPLIAVADGVVVESGSDGGQGNYVHVYDPKRGQTYVYMHMIAPASVGVGEQVGAGQELGGVGCTGSCSGDHLHFEIRSGKGFGGKPRDPRPELARWESVERPLS